MTNRRTRRADRDEHAFGVGGQPSLHSRALLYIALLAALTAAAVALASHSARTEAGGVTLKVERIPGGDAAAAVWSPYGGDDFSHYQLVACEAAHFYGSSCGSTVYKSGAVWNRNATALTVPGISADKGYGFILQIWPRSGPAQKVSASLAAPAPPKKPDPTPTPTPTPAPALTAERTAGGTGATLTWTAYSGSDFEAYQAVVCEERHYDGASCSETVYKSGALYGQNSASPHTVKNLEADTGYGVILQTWRTGVTGALKSHATLPGGPSISAPSNITVTPGDGYYDIAWDAVEGATGYDVRAKAEGSSSWHDVASNVTGTSYRYTTDKTIDAVAVRSRNSGGAGAWDELSRTPPANWLTTVQQDGVSAASAQAQNKLAAPAWGTITRDNGYMDRKLHLNWTAVSGATGYNVVCSDLDGWSWWQCGSVTSGTTTSLTIDNDVRSGSDLGLYRSYKLSIRAVNGNSAEASDWTNSENIRPVSGHLYDLVVTRGNGSITLTWTPPAWVTGYLIDCAVVTGSNPAYTRCATLPNQSDTASEHTVTVSSWTVGSTNYTIDNTKSYDIKIISTNKWGQARTIAPVVGPYSTASRLTAGSVASTGATLTVNNYAGRWWYQRTSPSGDSTCHHVASGTTAGLRNLTPDTAYTYKAFDKTGCTNADEMGTASFTTQSAPSVSNLSETTDGFGVLISASSSAATGFTTGGNGGGYTLRSVTVKFRSVDAFARDTLTVAVHAVSSGDPAASATYTLSGADPTGAGESTFTCSGGCSLSANTTYFLVLKGDSSGQRGFSWDTTASTDQTNTPSTFGWSIADAAEWNTGSGWSSQSGWTGIFKVSAMPDPYLTASSVAATTATLTIGEYSGPWYYKHTNTGATCEGPVSGTTKNLAGLTGGTAYTYSAYSDSTCTTGNLLATASTFTTPVTVSTLGGSLYQRYEVGNYLDTQQQGAQAFTTGSNTGGYTLSSIDVRISSKVGNPTNLVVTLHAASGSNPNTTTTLATLSGNSSPSSGTHTYTCSGSGCALSASTTYFVLMKAASSPGTSYYSVDLTAAAETKQPSGNGWSIADKGRDGIAGTWLDMLAAVKMKVTATPE